MINKHEIECMVNYYYGNTELKEIGYKEMKEIYESDNVKRIYGVYDEDEQDAWYFVVTKKGKSKIVPKIRENIEGYRLIGPLKEDVEFFHIRPDLLKKYARGIYPLFYKNDEIDYKKKIDCGVYLQESQYPFCYAKYGRNFLTFSKWNNIFVMNKYESEEEAILSLLNDCECENNIANNDLFIFVVDNRNYNKDLSEALIL